MSVTEQRYQAVLDVIGEGRAVMEVASQWGVSRRTVHRWLARDEVDGLEGLPDRGTNANRVEESPLAPRPPRSTSQTCWRTDVRLHAVGWTICDNHIDKCESASSVAKYRARRRFQAGR
jgi:transposase-like protein